KARHSPALAAMYRIMIRLTACPTASAPSVRSSGRPSIQRAQPAEALAIPHDQDQRTICTTDTWPNRSRRLRPELTNHFRTEGTSPRGPWATVSIGAATKRASRGKPETTGNQVSKQSTIVDWENTSTHNGWHSAGGKNFGRPLR